MAEKKTKVIQVETADLPLAVRRVIKTYESGERYAACGNCGVKLVNIEERVKCKFCWNCGRPVIWK